MPEWMADITVGEIIMTLGGIALVIGIILKLGKPIKKASAALDEFVSDWNGRPERRDDSGAIITPARPGVIAQLETVRAQVQNSHGSNLRDDMDKIHRMVEDLREEVVNHIAIAKASDDRQDETERIVTKYLPALRKLLED